MCLISNGWADKLPLGAIWRWLWRNICFWVDSSANFGAELVRMLLNCDLRSSFLDLSTKRQMPFLQEHDDSCVCFCLLLWIILIIMLYIIVMVCVFFIMCYFVVLSILIIVYVPFCVCSVSLCCSVCCLCVNVHCAAVLCVNVHCTAVLCVLFVCNCVPYCCIVCTVCV
jgi:hypothetical protein